MPCSLQHDPVNLGLGIPEPRLASVCPSNPLQNPPPLPPTCYRLPRDPGYGSPHYLEVRTRGLDLWEGNVEYFFILLNKLIIKSVYTLLCSSRMYRHPLLLHCSAFIQSLSMPHILQPTASLRYELLHLKLHLGAMNKSVVQQMLQFSTFGSKSYYTNRNTQQPLLNILNMPTKF